jgi:hypothetical protein
MTQQYQGDVSIIKLTKAEKNLSFEPLKNGFIVAEGEVSGHHHKLVADRESIVEIARDTNGFYLNVKKGTATLTHQSHAPQTIEKGLYFLGRQYEYNEVEERKVLD